MFNLLKDGGNAIEKKLKETNKNANFMLFCSKSRKDIDLYGTLLQQNQAPVLLSNSLYNLLQFSCIGRGDI